MTDATEAARRILRGISTESTRYHDANTVARALLAGNDEVVERCAQVADHWCEQNGHPNGAWSIAEHIRALRSKP